VKEWQRKKKEVASHFLAYKNSVVTLIIDK